MKGRITTLVDPETAQCFITTRDNKRYEFTLDDWRGDIYLAPEEGMEVNFEIDGTHARTVYAIDRVFEIVRQYPGPVTLNALRLDEDGYEIKKLFSRQRIAWDATLLPSHPAVRKDQNLMLSIAPLRIRGFTSMELMRIMTEWCKLKLGM